MKLIEKLKNIFHMSIIIYGKIKIYNKYRKFKKEFLTLAEWKGFQLKLNGDSSTSAEEPFTHYDAFYYWIAKEISQKKDLKILDVGGKKLINGWLSVANHVTSVNLTSPIDKLSKVDYVAADVTKSLPFNDDYFDVFISPVTLNLIGLGRYGDNIDPKAIPKFIQELSRCMKQNGIAYISVVLGNDQLLFNHHYIISFPTIKKLFTGWKIKAFLIDNQEITLNSNSERFSEDLQNKSEVNSERILFLKLERT
jgi:SAM-dependent methyltransferase